jgi:hypothetical protein
LLCRNDEARQPLSRKVSIPSSRINPYRLVIVLRLVVLCIFLHYRLTNPVRNAYALWLVSVICEIWFAISWILDQFPKWLPVNRETYLDRLALRYSLLNFITICIFYDSFCYFFDTQSVSCIDMIGKENRLN